MLAEPKVINNIFNRYEFKKVHYVAGGIGIFARRDFRRRNSRRLKKKKKACF